MSGHTLLPWNIHPLYPLACGVSHAKASDTEFDFWGCRIASGDRIIGEIEMQSRTDGGFPHVEDIEEARANARIVLLAVNNHQKLVNALRAIVDGVDANIKERVDNVPLHKRTNLWEIVNSARPVLAAIEKEAAQ